MTNSNQNNMLMGILAYLGILVIIPYLVDKNNPFVKFHIKQGLVLLAIEIIAWVLAMLFGQLYMILWIVKLAVFVLAVIGIINVVQNQEKNLPLVGDWAKYFNV